MVTKKFRIQNVANHGERKTPSTDMMGRIGLLGALVYPGCRNRIPPAELLKQQTFVFSLFWRLDVQD